ncbi:restriction endonuclease subunit S [Thermococcus aciditolerans]|uniref:Type I restriction modification DNA specificity domain-containing protein n=1 Tax=Thermococcus aciditolerans TaxID=2598455 RepID=A0A5C0SPA9_9EURY|nr:restriction endonuclease subunit S [Thermococcus aciditolerans]QEK15274.1 hypothetical protein FPV09_09395 [Thermococcus aciditolerans]
MREKPLTEFMGSKKVAKGQGEKPAEPKVAGLKGPWELPEGWRWVRLGEVAGIRGNSGVKKKIAQSMEAVFIPMELIPERGIFARYEIRKSEEVKSYSYCEPGDILLAKITPSFENGKQGIVPEVPSEFALATTEVYAIYPKDKTLIETMYLFHFLRSSYARRILEEQMLGTTGRQRVPKEAVLKLQIPLPPLKEQKHIVAKLDEVSKRLEEAKKLAREAREEAEKLMASALHEVFSKAEERGWEWRKLNEICEKITDRDHKTPKYTPQGIPVISPENFTPFGIDFKSAKKYIPEEDYKKELRRVDPKPGDILYSRIGTIGEARLLKEFPPFIPLHSLVLIRPNTQVVTSEYLLYVLNSQIVRVQAKEKTRSIGTPDLGIREIRRFRIPLPPLNEQKRIVAYLDSVSERAQKLVKLYEEREKELEQLLPAILDRAFRGEL